MKRIASLALICGTLGAQAHVTSPPGFVTAEGRSYSYRFADYPWARHMQFDGTWMGSQFAITEVALRPHRNNAVGTARSWSMVTLDMAPCDMSNLSATFDQNPTAPPTRAFSGPVTWAAASPTSSWGGPQGGMRFPFTSPWIHTGQSGICLDYNFAGGTLPTKAWLQSSSEAFYLDCHYTGNVEFRKETGYGGSTTSGCRDTAQHILRFSSLSLGSFTHGPQSQYGASHQLHLYGAGLAPSSTAVVAASPSGNPTGVAFPGVLCNRLYVDLSTALLMPFATSRGRPPWVAGGVFGETYFLPVSPSSVGTQIWVQAAFADTNLGTLKLTNATSNTLAPLPRTYPKFEIHARTSATGPKPIRAILGPSNLNTANPLLRYQR